jgi:hypothetical protein
MKLTCFEYLDRVILYSELVTILFQGDCVIARGFKLMDVNDKDGKYSVSDRVIG